MRRQVAIKLQYCYLGRRVNKTCQRATICPPLLSSRGGQLIWLGCNFEKAAYSGGPYFLLAIEASLGSTNVYCDELDDISDLKIFLNASAGH